MSKYLAGLFLATSSVFLGNALAFKQPDAGARRCDSTVGDARSWTVGKDDLAGQIACIVHGRKVVLFGEVHGSSEVPAFVERLVEASAKERPVILGLERNTDESAALDGFVQGGDVTSSRKRLLSSGEWSGGMADGRSSKGMIDLLSKVRELRSKGADIRVVLLERPPSDPSEIDAAGGIQAYIDRSMANEAKSALAKGGKNSLFIGYMGELHAAPSSNATDGNGGSVSDRLSDLNPLVILATGAGSAWNCTSAGCGVHPVSMRKSAAVSSGSIDVRTLVFPSLSASLPAVKH